MTLERWLVVRNTELDGTSTIGWNRSPCGAPIAPVLVGLGAAGRYRVLGLLGAGGMGVVFEAYDRVLERSVALKIVRTGIGEGDRDEAAAQVRLAFEARAMAKVSHPNVTAIFDVGAAGDRMYIAMELVRGGTLRNLVGARRPWREVLGLLMQAGRGLAAAHAAGVIHRDFKPDNVLLGTDGAVRVVDFGLACIRSAPDRPVLSGTSAGAIAGTPAYMAPERIGLEATASSDQFAFCVTAYELLEGRRPFGDVTGAVCTPQAFRELVETRRPWTRLDVPARMRAIFDRGMHPEPARRWADLDVLLAELEVHDPVRAPRPPRPPRPHRDTDGWRPMTRGPRTLKTRRLLRGSPT